jgi:hypothetical protein
MDGFVSDGHLGFVSEGDLGLGFSGEGVDSNLGPVNGS